MILSRVMAILCNLSRELPPTCLIRRRGRLGHMSSSSRHIERWLQNHMKPVVLLTIGMQFTRDNLVYLLGKNLLLQGLLRGPLRLRKVRLSVCS